MRLLHTSDWHLGRSLHRSDLRDAQAAHLDHLVEVVRSERVDAVLVAGDVFDRAVPPVDAVALYDDALVRLREAGARVVVTSGNHDSASRLGVGARLVDAAGVHVRTRPQDCGAPVLMADEHGAVAVYGLPYLEPDAVRTVLPPDPDGAAEVPRGHAGVLGRAMACVRADLSRRSARSVVLAHAWVTGGELSDSERDIRVGGVGDVSAALFDGIDYTALGHLHGAQVLRPGLRYSGSPLAFSFAEAAHVKGSWLVELDARGLASVEQVPAPVPRRLSSLSGRLADLLVDPALAPQERDWLSVVLTDPVRPDDAMARLRTRFPFVLVLDWQPEGAVADERSYGARVAGRDDLEVVAEFVRHVRCGGSTSDEGAADEAERALLAQALEAGRLAAASA
ncbi:MAG: repair protein SbcD/Mre11 [Actinomycetota bacterium]|nr:repair protein SbcD/Mre11 [Actinomycetota bacterium]